MDSSIKTSINDVNSRHFLPIKKICSAVLNKRTVFKDGKKINANVGTIHSLLKLYCKNSVEEKVCEIIADSIVFCEKKFPTSGMALIAMINESLEEKSNFSQRVSFNDAKNSAISVINNRVAQTLFNEIVTIAGADSKISVVRQPIEKPIIKIKSKPEVRIQIPEKFVGIDFVLPQEISDVYFFMINGAASQISELEFIFNRSSESNAYFVIATRSFTDEILEVLKINFINQKLKIIPAVFGFDLDSINSIADLRAIVGGLPISSDLGDIISGDHSARFGYSEKVILEKDSFKFYGNSAGNVDAQVTALKDKIKNAESQDKQELFTRRLSDLTGNSCEVILPHGEVFDTIARELGIAFAILKACCAYLCKEVSISSDLESVYFPEPSLQIAALQFVEVCKIFQNTNRAVVRDDVH